MCIERQSVFSREMSQVWIIGWRIGDGRSAKGVRSVIWTLHSGEKSGRSVIWTMRVVEVRCPVLGHFPTELHDESASG